MNETIGNFTIGYLPVDNIIDKLGIFPTTLLIIIVIWALVRHIYFFTVVKVNRYPQRMKTYMGFFWMDIFAILILAGVTIWQTI